MLVARSESGRAPRTWPQRLLLGFNILLVVACLGLAFALTKVRTTLQAVPVVDVGSSLSSPQAVDEPRNILIIGTDAFEGLDEDDPVANGREAGQKLADVIMVLRIDPRAGTAQLLSIPRDTRLELPDGSNQRINAATMLSNGPRSLIQTIKRNFGISIDNYVQVDFASFKELIEVLGSVPVYFTSPVRDRTTGLDVPQAGCVQLGPDQALAYARSRSLEVNAFGEWVYDPTGDLGRITRQQDFMKRAIRAASDRGIRNPQTAIGIVDAAVGAVVIDDRLNVDVILQLLSQFREFNPDELATVQVPTVDAPADGVAYQRVLWDQAIPIIRPFWGVDPAVGVQPGNVIVDVQAGSAGRESAELTTAALDGVGFDAEAYSGRSTDETTIVHGPDGRDAAILLARHLDVVPQLSEDETIVGNRVVLVLGEDPGGVRTEPKPLEELPEEFQPRPTTTTTTTSPPTTAPVDPTALPGVPTTTVPEGVFLPTDPEKAATCR